MCPIESSPPGRVRWWLYPASARKSRLLDKLMCDPSAVLSGPGSVAREIEGRKRFFRVPGEDGEPALFVKLFQLSPGPRRLRYWRRPSKARIEATWAQRIATAGFHVAGPIAVGEERRFGVLRRSYSVVPEIDARDLRRRLDDPALTPDRRRALMRAFAVFARQLHDRGIDQDDFSPNNFLVTKDLRFILIDFERCRMGAPLGNRRWRMLAKLHRNDAGISLTDRIRFLRDYLGADDSPQARREACDAIEREFRSVRVRDARHAARSAFRRGRYLTHERDEWTVRGREQSPVIRLSLSAREARRVWILAHQLERLSLPALRPVRMTPSFVELEDRPVPSRPFDTNKAIQKAIRRLERYGHVYPSAEWVLSNEGARLRDPRSFCLEIERIRKTLQVKR